MKRRLISFILTVILIVNLLMSGDFGLVQAVYNENLAYNKPVSASNYEIEATSPEKAVDADMDTRWGTDQNRAVGEWLEIDLEQTYLIKQINIFFERKDADQNILGYKIELYSDGTYYEVYRKEEKAAQIEKIVLDEKQSAAKVKITILAADGGTLNWVNVGINEIEIYSEEANIIEATENKNHVRNAVMSASSVEQNLERLNAAKANDGSRDTRWASDYQAPGTQWLKAEFPGYTKIEQVNLYLLSRDVAPGDSNVEQFSIKYLGEDGSEHYLVQNYENTSLGSGKGWRTDVSIILEEPIVAKDITVCEFVANSTSYNNISIAELEAYSNEQSEVVTLDSVVSGISGGTIGKDVTEFVIPSVPDGYEIVMNGADFEQIIARDGKLVHPLTDKLVQVSFEVTEAATGDKKKTSDLPFVVEGTYDEQENQNTKPVIIPEIAEWYSDSTQVLAVEGIDTVVYDSDDLQAIVDEFIADYEDFTGIRLSAEKGSAKENAFNFAKQAPDELLGEEGYTLDILSDRILVKSAGVTGNMYGMQTILQMYRQNPDSFPIGQMRDYPRFETRGFMLDVARKPISLEMIKEISRTMRYYKMNDFQVHLSDNYIFLEDYGKLENENEAFKAYEAFRLESSLTNDKGEGPTAEDYSISKKDFKDFITDERALGMKIVPEIDMPAHATSFTKVWPELMVQNQVSMMNSNRPLIDHLDVSKPETMDKIKEIFDDYTKGDDPTFDAETTVHIGADEFLSDYTAYRQFINELIPYVKETNTVRMWGGLTWIDDKKTEIINEAIEDVEINLWSSGWADGLQMYNMGYKLINIIDDFGYMVPNGGKGRGAYGDLLNINRIFNDFEPNRVRTQSGYQYVPSGDAQMLGAAFAIWSDNIDKAASGLTESDLYWRFFDAMPFYAEKNWAATGQEKGSAAALTALAEEQGTGPRTNPYYQADKTGTSYASYDFNDGFEDKSANGRDLVAGTAKVADNALSLTGGNSYAASPFSVLGNGNQLSFDIMLSEPAKPGQIIFEADAPYGTHDIRIMDNGKLGFTRELYDYYFDYELPVGKLVNVKLTVEQQKTRLYIDDELVGDASGKFIHKEMVKKQNLGHSTFALPLQRIGSKTDAVKALVDNVIVAELSPSEDIYQKDKWTGTTNSETVYNEKEGLLRYAYDNNTNTIWHSNWQGASDKLTGTNSFYAEIDFGEKYVINQFSFTPRTDANSGRITKADLYVKENADDEWIKIEEDKIFAADATKKTFYFEAQAVQFVRFVAKDSNDGWVAVSEFDIDNKAMPTLVVYVTATEGGTVSGGGEVRKGEPATITAVPANGYIFTGWYTAGGDMISEEAEYTFTVQDNTALIAYFEKTDDTITLGDLNELYEKACEYSEDEYGGSYWELFADLRDKAKILIDSQETDSAKIAHAYHMLNLSMSLLTQNPGSDVDLTILEIILDEAQNAIDSKEVDKAIKDVQASFYKAFEYAKEVYNKGAQADPEEIWEAATELLKQLHCLGIIKGNKDYLQELYDLLSDLDLNDYRDGDAKNKFVEVYDKAGTILVDENAIDTELEAVYKELYRAALALEPKDGAVDKTILKQAIDIANICKENIHKYVEKGQAEFFEALRKAVEVYDDDGADEQQVKEAYETLVTATARLRYKADKLLLEESYNKLLQEAADIDFSKYTEESVKLFNSILDSARVMIEDETLSEDDQPDIDSMTIQLNNAIILLQEKSTDSTDETESDTAQTDGETDEETNGESNGETAGQSDTTKSTDGKTKETDGKNTGASGKDKVKTGDTSAFMATILLSVMALTTLCVFLRKRSRK